jgi:hypothetical protein
LLDASLATVEAMAQLHSKAALVTLLAIAQRGSDELIRVRAARAVLEIATRLGALQTPLRH